MGCYSAGQGQDNSRTLDEICASLDDDINARKKTARGKKKPVEERGLEGNDVMIVFRAFGIYECEVGRNELSDSKTACGLKSFNINIRLLK